MNWVEKLYPDRTPIERKRICIVQIIATLVAFLAIGFCIWMMCDQQEKYSNRLRNCEKVVIRVLNEDTFQSLSGCVYPNNDFNHPSKQEIISCFEAMFLQIKDPNNQIQVENVQKQILKKCNFELLSQFPFVQNKRMIMGWIILAIIYCCITTGLYHYKLKLKDGEPMFNILDVGFYTSLVSFTGGVSSSMILMLIASILLSAFEHIRGKNDLGDNTYWLKTIAYAWALILSLFLAIHTGNNYTELIVKGILYLVIGSIIWFVGKCSADIFYLNNNSEPKHTKVIILG